MFTFSDHSLDDAMLSSLPVGMELNTAATDTLRLARQAQARVIVMAYRIGLGAYERALARVSGWEQMGVNAKADKLALRS